MGGILGGGGGTQTTNTINHPFNENELKAINTRGIELLNTPYEAYGGQTYAPPSDQYHQALTGASDTALDAARRISGSMAGLQGTAQYVNNDYANGQAYKAVTPWNEQMGALGSFNPAQGAMDSLQGTSGGANRGDLFSNALYNNGQQNSTGYGQSLLNPIASGDMFNRIAAGPGQQLGSIAGGSGLRGAMPLMMGYAGALGSPGGQAAQAMAGGYGLGQGQLGATAGGGYLAGSPGANPWLDSVYDTAARKVQDTYQTSIAPSIASDMEAQGRFHSGAQYNAQGQAEKHLLDSLGGLASSIYAPAYESERGRQVAAAGQLGDQQTQNASSLMQQYIAALTGQSNLYNTQTGYGLEAAKSQGDLYNSQSSIMANAANALGQLAMGGQNANTQALSAGGQIYNTGVSNMSDAARILGSLGISGNQAQQSALQNAITNSYTGSNIQRQAALDDVGLANLGIQDYQTGINAQQGLQQQNQAALNDAAQRYYSTQQQEYSHLGQVAQILSGIMPAYPGATTQTSPVAGQNPLGALLGGLTGGAQLLGGGASGGGLLALLGMLSDRRLKTDIQRVGTLDNGLPVYSYRLFGGPTQIGLMADEVEKVNPAAVAEDSMGIKRVFYDLAVMNKEES